MNKEGKGKEVGHRVQIRVFTVHNRKYLNISAQVVYNVCAWKTLNTCHLSKMEERRFILGKEKEPKGFVFLKKQLKVFF